MLCGKRDLFNAVLAEFYDRLIADIEPRLAAIAGTRDRLSYLIARQLQIAVDDPASIAAMRDSCWTPCATEWRVANCAAVSTSRSCATWCSAASSTTSGMGWGGSAGSIRTGSPRRWSTTSSPAGRRRRFVTN
jgi:hypothetical protein